MQVEANLKERQIASISLHGDADGITSGVLLCLGLNLSPSNIKITYPKSFGDTFGGPDIILDQKPTNKLWSGICIDHHPGHPSKEERNYSLIWDSILPTTGIVYELLRESIPEEQRWKAIIGLSGDGKDVLLDKQIWRRNPELLELTGYPRISYGKFDWYPIPLFAQAVSLINFGARIGAEEESFNILYNAKTIKEIIYNQYLRQCRDTITKEVEKALKESTIVEYPYFLFVEYSSPYKLYLAQKIAGSTAKTIIALNNNLNRISIRGPLTSIIIEGLQKFGINAGGHEGFGGANLTEAQASKIREFIDTIRDTWQKEDEDVEKRGEVVPRASE